MLGALTLDQLRVLTTIADSGSFSAAGRKLRRVQSAISQSVRTLETAQGVALFDRSSKTPVLTEAGRVLVAQARQVQRQAELFESIATEIAAGLEPELTLAMDSFLPTGPVIDSLQALRMTYPNLPVTLYTEGLGAAQRRLRDRSAALALCAMFPTAQQEMQTYPLMSIALIPVASSSHPLATETRPITRDVLQEHVQLILTDPYDFERPQSWRRQFADLALCRHGIAAGLPARRLGLGDDPGAYRQTISGKWKAGRTRSSRIPPSRRACYRSSPPMNAAVRPGPPHDGCLKICRAVCRRRPRNIPPRRPCRSNMPACVRVAVRDGNKGSQAA